MINFCIKRNQIVFLGVSLGALGMGTLHAGLFTAGYEAASPVQLVRQFVEEQIDDPLNPIHAYNIGIALQQQKKYAQAGKHFALAADLYPAGDAGLIPVHFSAGDSAAADLLEQLQKQPDLKGASLDGALETATKASTQYGAVLELDQEHVQARERKKIIDRLHALLQQRKNQEEEKKEEQKKQEGTEQNDSEKNTENDSEKNTENDSGQQDDQNHSDSPQQKSGKDTKPQNTQNDSKNNNSEKKHDRDTSKANQHENTERTTERDTKQSQQDDPEEQHNDADRSAEQQDAERDRQENDTPAQEEPQPGAEEDKNTSKQSAHETKNDAEARSDGDKSEQPNESAVQESAGISEQELTGEDDKQSEQQLSGMPAQQYDANTELAKKRGLVLLDKLQQDEAALHKAQLLRQSAAKQRENKGFNQW
jgi:hypothetical protein